MWCAALPIKQHRTIVVNLSAINVVQHIITARLIMTVFDFHHKINFFYVAISHRSDLSENKIAVLSPAIGRLKSLTRLDLHTNNLESVPHELGQLSRLKHLSLHFNKLKELTPGIGGCTSLVWLTLNANELETLPKVRRVQYLNSAGHLLDCCQDMCSVPERFFDVHSSIALYES